MLVLTSENVYITIEEKFCTKCQTLKTAEEFSKSKSNKDGLQTWCKDCLNARKKAYRKTAEGKAKTREQYEKYMSEPARKEERLAYAREYGQKAEVKERRNERKRQRKAEEPGYKEKVAEYQKEYYKEYVKTESGQEAAKRASEKYRNSEKGRATKREYNRLWKNTTPMGRLKTYRENAGAKGLIFELTIEHFEKYWQVPCVYCNSEIETIGLDRIDNSIGYVETNITPCCASCNYMKYVHSADEFINKCQLISFKHSNHPHPNQILLIESANYDVKRFYRVYRDRSSHKKIFFDISFDKFLELGGEPCYYCDQPRAKFGLDKIDPNGDYVLGNVVPCCEVCNKMKKQMNQDEFIKHCALVSSHQNSLVQ